MIKYYASEILPETTDKLTSGLHTDVFITTITSHTFEDGVGEIVFEEDLTRIGNSAFRGCSITKIKLPNSVTSIDGLAFYQCTSLTSITIPSSVTFIGGGAFNHCTSLTSITIPDSVTSIESSAFQSCISLTSINIPDSVTSIGGGAFSGVEFESVIFDGINPNATFERDEENKILVNKSHDTLITGFNEPTVIVPNNIKTIGNSAFNNCTSLTSITIGNSVTSIETAAFQSCISLTSITIPNSVTSIGGGAFSDSGITSIVIPSSMTSIGIGAIGGCRALLEVTIPSSITSINVGAFGGCTSLTSITSLATTAPSVQNGAFANCGTNGTLKVPTGSTGYDAWLSMLPNGWTIVEQ